MKKLDNDDKRNKKINNTDHKVGILMKLLLPTLLTIVILSIVLCTSSYNVQKKNLINDGVKSTILFAKIGINMIGSYKFSYVKEVEDMESDSYKSIYKGLEKIKESSNIEYIYTVYLEDERLYYGVDVDPNEKTQRKPGDIYDYDYKANIEYETLKEGKIYSDREFTYFDNKPYITSIIPVFNELGEVIGGVGCDYSGTKIVKTLNKTIKKLVLVMCIVIVMSAIIIMFVMKRIVKNIDIINNKMITLINSEGDLTQELNIASGDEIESIANNTNNFLSSIRKMIVNILGHTFNLEKRVNISFENMKVTNTNVTNVDSTLQSLNISMNNVASACDMITGSTKDIKGFVDDLNDFINKGVSNAIDINSYAKESSEKNNDNYNSVRNKAIMLSEELNEKLNKSKEIAKISKLVDNIIDITDQTNLLALNASIEAARSGESGKGFVIVAEQISKLAALTGHAATKIQDVINNIINSVDELTDEARNMLDFMDDVLFKGYNELVDNSNLYFRDSKELANLFKIFAESSESLLNNINNVQLSIELVNENANINAENIDAITVIFADMAKKISGLYSKINDIKLVCDNLNLEVNKFKV